MCTYIHIAHTHDVSACLRMNIYTFMHACLSVYTCVCMYVYIYIMYIYTHTHIGQRDRERSCVRAHERKKTFNNTCIHTHKHDKHTRLLQIVCPKSIWDGCNLTNSQRTPHRKPCWFHGHTHYMHKQAYTRARAHTHTHTPCWSHGTPSSSTGLRKGDFLVNRATSDIRLSHTYIHTYIHSHR